MKQIFRPKKCVNHILSMFLLVLTLYACNTHIPPGSPRNVKKHMHAGSDNKKVIFILNGLWQDAQTFDYTIRNLLIAFESEDLQVEVRNLTETITSEKSIEQQASDAFVELKQQLAREKYEIILVGHSQGGLRGAKILSLNKQEGNPLDIRGLVTLGTPWEGAPGATITKSFIQSFLDRKPVTYLLTGLTYVYLTSEQFTNGSIGNLFDRYFPTHEPGVQDMIPHSDFLQVLSASLTDNHIPILAIAGVNRDVKRFLFTGEDTYIRYIHKVPPVVFNAFYARIFAGGWNTEHDLMVPVYSQLAQNVSKSDAFETYIVKGAIHDFLPGLLIPEEKVIYNQAEVISKIVNFSKLNFGFGLN